MARCYGEDVDVLVKEVRFEEPAEFSAVVAIGDREERWPVTRRDAKGIAAEFKRQREEQPPLPVPMPDDFVVPACSPVRFWLERPAEILTPIR